MVGPVEAVDTDHARVVVPTLLAPVDRLAKQQRAAACLVRWMCVCMFGHVLVKRLGAAHFWLPQVVFEVLQLLGRETGKEKRRILSLARNGIVERFVDVDFDLSVLLEVKCRRKRHEIALEVFH